MLVLVLVKATASSEQPFNPEDPSTQQRMVAMGRFNDELRAAGIFRTAAGLQPSSAGVRVAFDGPQRSILHGPFAQVAELVAGYWLWEVQNMDEAIAWVRRCPNPMREPSEIEVRPLYEFGNPQ